MEYISEFNRIVKTFPMWRRNKQVLLSLHMPLMLHINASGNSLGAVIIPENDKEMIIDACQCLNPRKDTHFKLTRRCLLLLGLQFSTIRMERHLFLQSEQLITIISTGYTLSSLNWRSSAGNATPLSYASQTYNSRRHARSPSASRGDTRSPEYTGDLILLWDLQKQSLRGIQHRRNRIVMLGLNEFIFQQPVIVIHPGVHTFRHSANPSWTSTLDLLLTDHPHLITV